MVLAQCIVLVCVKVSLYYGVIPFYDVSLYYPTPRIALFVRWFVGPSVTKFAASSCLAHFVLSALAHSTNDEYQESAVLFEPLYTRPERPKGAKDEVKRPEGPPTRSRGPEGP